MGITPINMNNPTAADIEKLHASISKTLQFLYNPEQDNHRLITIGGVVMQIGVSMLIAGTETVYTNKEIYDTLRETLTLWETQGLARDAEEKEKEKSSV